MDIFWVIEAAGHRWAVRVELVTRHQALALHTLITITIKQNTGIRGVWVWVSEHVALLSIFFSSSTDASIQIYELAANYLPK